MLLDSLCTPFRRARLVSQTSSGYVAKSPTATEPDGDDGTATGPSVIEFAPLEGGAMPGSALILFYGEGANNATFSCRVIGWKSILVNNDPTKKRLWIPVTLCEVQVTLSTVVGVAGADVDADDRFADTLALVGTSGNPNVSMEMISPQDNTIASLMVSLKGMQKLELSFDTTSSATNCNALLALI